MCHSVKKEKGEDIIFKPGLEAITRDACITRYDTRVNLWSVLFVLILHYVLSDLPDNKEKSKERIKEKRNTTSSSFSALLFKVEMIPGHKCTGHSKNKIKQNN